MFIRKKKKKNYLNSQIDPNMEAKKRRKNIDK